ncbi:MAG: carbohydrate ABC transporter permease, partial [Clostridia bacterium]|nr:carbohydrate ABC transporter permease [Clostridia bacterium]
MAQMWPFSSVRMALYSGACSKTLHRLGMYLSMYSSRLMITPCLAYFSRSVSPKPALNTKSGKGFFNVMFVTTMFFGGGLIPTYLLISDLGMLDTIWAILIPGAFSVWNMIIARTYYMGIPHDMQEAAEIDGASEMVYFFKILLPLCMPIIAT